MESALDSAANRLPLIRVGVPLPRGRLLDYAVASGLPLMFSANAFARYRDGRFAGFNLEAAAAIPEDCDASLDSAGFTAAAHYGDYLFTLDDYLDLVATRRWAFWSAMDYCVEPAVAPDPAMRRLRVDATIARYGQCYERAKQRGLPAPLPVLQGIYPDEYLRCARELGVGPGTPLVGIGSVCRRHLHGPDGVLAIMSVLDRELPAGVQAHMFGLKGAGTLGVLMRGFPGRIASTDSMAYDMGVRRAMPTGRTQEIRGLAMMEWHERETRQLQGAAPALPFVPRVERERSAREIALDALGGSFGDLLVDGDLEYRDGRHYVSKDSSLVSWLIQSHGPQAFEAEEPENDYGLGSSYGDIREALVQTGHLA